MFKYLSLLIFGKSVRYIDFIYQYCRDFLINKDFRGIIELKGYDTYYQSSRYYEIKKIFKDLDIENKVIMDVGSGKGLILYLATKFNFKDIYGVEISKQMYNISINNLKNTNVKIFNNSFFNLETKLLKKIDIYFLFNPFSQIDEFIKTITKFQEKEIIVIYINPVYHESFIQNDNFIEVKQYDFFVSTTASKIYKTTF